MKKIMLLVTLVACGGADIIEEDAGGTDAALVDAFAQDILAGDASAPGADASVTLDGGGEIDGDVVIDASMTTDSAAPDAGATCTLSKSGPLSVTADGSVIENLHIRAFGETALHIQADDVVVRNVWIEHEGGPGIVVSGSNVQLEDIDIDYTGAPASGPNPSPDHYNIEVIDSPDVRITRARLTRGSSGVYLAGSPRSTLRFIQGDDFRGPFPRGQLVQWNASSNGVLEDFSVVNNENSWPEDNVNVYRSVGMEIRRGRIEGNNSPSGIGLIFDGCTVGSDCNASGVVEDVDAVAMGNGCFSAFRGNGGGTTFRRTRCRDNICTSQQGRGVPGSDALMWAGQPGVSGLRVEDSQFAEACNPDNISWPNESFEALEIEERDFEPRAPLDLAFCWD